MSVAALSMAIGWLCPVQAQAMSSAVGCGQHIFPQVSPETARRAGMALRSDGRYEMDLDALAAKAGSPADLLRVSQQQYQSNKQWLASMGNLVADPDTPLLPEVRLLYQQGWETNGVEMSIIHAMECRLGLPLSDLEAPKTPALAVAERETRIAQNLAQEQAESRRLANRASFNQALGGLANMLSGAANALGPGSSAGGGGACPVGGPCATVPGN